MTTSPGPATGVGSSTTLAWRGADSLTAFMT
jgi:hypothetical protein